MSPTSAAPVPPGNGALTVRLDPLPTRRATTAIAQLCQHVTTTQTRNPAPSSSGATESTPTHDNAETMTPCQES